MNSFQRKKAYFWLIFGLVHKAGLEGGIL